MVSSVALSYRQGQRFGPRSSRFHCSVILTTLLHCQIPTQKECARRRSLEESTGEDRGGFV